MTETKLVERANYGLHASLAELLPKVDYQTSVLDIGSGSGAWLERLANLGFTNLHGIDLDIEQFKTKEATCSKINLDTEDYRHFGKDKFGLITAIELLEHLENPGHFFNQVSYLLAPDGWLIITTPNIHSVVSRLRFLLTGHLRQFDGKGDPTHIYPVLLSSLERILKRYNLEIITKETYPKGGTITSRPSLKIGAMFLSFLVSDNLPGDNLILFIRKSSFNEFS